MCVLACFASMIIGRNARNVFIFRINNKWSKKKKKKEKLKIATR